MSALTRESLPALVEQAVRAVREAGSFGELKELRDRAEALRLYARSIDAGLEAQNRCAELKLRAERRMGAELARLELPGGDRRSKLRDATLKLADLGIAKHQSARWQAIAALSEVAFEGYVGGALDGDGELTSAGALALAKRAGQAGAREANLAGLAEATAAASESLGGALYNVILADCPWRFEPRSRETGLDRAADNHYPTLSLEELRGLAVPGAADCVLFHWATVPMLTQALEVMAAWGFAYKSHLVWAKDRAGTGYWARNRHELLLIGTRGAIPAPLPGSQPDSLIPAPLGAHSAKPAVFQEIIEGLYPGVAKLEIFARGQRPGWTCWGNQAGAVP